MVRYKNVDFQVQVKKEREEQFSFLEEAVFEEGAEGLGLYSATITFYLIDNEKLTVLVPAILLEPDDKELECEDYLEENKIIEKIYGIYSPNYNDTKTTKYTR